MGGLAGGLSSTPVASLGCPKPSVLWGPEQGKGPRGDRRGQRATVACLPFPACICREIYFSPFEREFGGSGRRGWAAKQAQPPHPALPSADGSEPTASPPRSPGAGDQKLETRLLGGLRYHVAPGRWASARPADTNNPSSAPLAGLCAAATNPLLSTLHNYSFHSLNTNNVPGTTLATLCTLSVVSGTIP